MSDYWYCITKKNEKNGDVIERSFSICGEHPLLQADELDLGTVTFFSPITEEIFLRRTEGLDQTKQPNQGHKKE